MKKQIVNEIFLLRSISCLAVVFIHSIGSALGNVDVYTAIDAKILAIIRTILNFGTPTFIFISEFLLAKSYPEGVPKGFFFKRFKFLLIPYMCMGFIYSFIDIKENQLTMSVSTILVETLKNIFLADYTGYFVIIIFQFYILHVLFNRILRKYKPITVLTVSLLINLAYLGYFNFTNPLSEYVWYYLSWMPFIGWIFYFTMGYYCGLHYEKFKVLLNGKKLLVLIMPIITLVFMLGLRYVGILTIPSSKTVGVLLFTPTVICLAIFLTSKINRVPTFLMVVSNYSFSIYLLHIALISALNSLFTRISQLNVYLLTVIIFVVAVGSSIVVSYLINKIPFGNYVVGNIMMFGKVNKKEKSISIKSNSPKEI